MCRLWLRKEGMSAFCSMIHLEQGWSKWEGRGRGSIPLQRDLGLASPGGALACACG